MVNRKILAESAAMALVVVVLYASSLFNYLLFHSLVEIVTVTVAFVVFILAWNTRRYVRPGYLKVIGVAYGFISLMDLIHTLAFRGMGVFPGNDANLATQLWIAARYLQALALCAAPFFVRRPVSDRLLIPVAFLAVAVPLVLILQGFFPACYIEGLGLTPFKVTSEYVISALFLVAIVLFVGQRKALEPRVFLFILTSISFAITSELAFTSYVSVYAQANLVGHLLKLAGFYFLYKALVDIGFKEPYQLIFRDLQESGKSLGQTLLERTAQLLESEERFRAVFEASPLGKALVSADGRLIEVNPTFGEMLGYSVAEMKLGAFADFTHPDDQAISQEVVRSLLSGERAQGRFEKRYVHRDGHPVWTEVNTALQRDASGNPLYFITAVSDISDRKRSDAERERLHAQLNQAQKMEAVGLLAGGVAHDFNNMLGVIMGRVQIAQTMTGPDQAIFGQLREIRRAAERSADLTRQLLAFARKQTIAPRVLDLNATLEGTLGLLRRLIGEAIEIEWLPSSVPVLVKMDPGQVDQVLANLCVNARDAIQSTEFNNGRIVIGTRMAEVDEAFCQTTDEGRPGSFIVVSVADNGQGMGAETKARIFEPFFTTKELGRGTGLGLATVYGIVRQNNGFITVTSEPGQGATFELYFPTAGEPISPVEDSSRQGQTRHDGKAALLVEDEPMLLEVVGAMLSDLGFTVDTVTNASEALQRAAALGRPFDLLVTDLVLPGMSGQELAQKMNGQAGLKVLFMSGYTASEVQVAGLASVFLQKPFTSRQFSEKVDQVLALAP